MSDWFSHWHPHDRHTCGDCGALEGQLHQPGCDMERCPFCHGQNISCDCRYKHFYPNYVPFHRQQWSDPEENDSGLPDEVYENGLPKEQEKEWDRLCKEKGRVPFIVGPNLCFRCGALWPDMFRVSDEEWERVVPADHRQEMLCRPCYNVLSTFADMVQKEGFTNAK